MSVIQANSSMSVTPGSETLCSDHSGHDWWIRRRASSTRSWNWRSSRTMSGRLTRASARDRGALQGEGMSLAVEEKVRVAHLLDDLGVPMIEAGFPASNPKEAELFRRLAGAGVRARVAAFGTTRRRGVAAADDPALRGLAESFAPVC